MFAGKKSAQIREILISESAWEEMTCLFAPSLEQNIRQQQDLMMQINRGVAALNPVRLLLFEHLSASRHE
ncbi:hypothetical protein AGG97_19030 [Klebsiella michiganensis]|nr:hypothetical protein AGG97_18335 [Klebsiella michiganensis]OLP11951.1 hypothetical protein AGG97_19030 [Klebsiella michiganensis]